MKLYIIILIILVSGCSKKNEYDNIEVLTYSWAHGNYKNIKDGFYIHCTTYSNINNSGKAMTFSDHGYLNEKPFYFTNDINKSLIDSIITLVKNIKINSIDKKIYDGPCIRIKINFTNQVSKIYTLPMIVQDTEFQPIRNLYHSFVNPKERGLIKKQAKFDKKKDAFIAEAMKYDTIRVPLPLE